MKSAAACRSKQEDINDHNAAANRENFLMPTGLK